MINMKRTPLELTPERPGMKSQTTPRIQKKRLGKKHWFFTRRFWARLRKCDTVVHFEGAKKWFFNKHPVKFKGPNPRKSKKHGFVTHSVYSTKRKSRGAVPSRTHAGASEHEISAALRRDQFRPFSKSCVLSRWFSGRFQNRDTVDQFETVPRVRHSPGGRGSIYKGVV